MYCNWFFRLKKLLLQKDRVQIFSWVSRALKKFGTKNAKNDGEDAKNFMVQHMAGNGSKWKWHVASTYIKIYIG